MEIQPDVNRPQVPENRLHDLSVQVKNSGQEAEKQLGSFRGKSITLLTDLVGTLPSWASQHIQAHEQLKKAVEERHVQGQKIPAEACNALNYSSTVMRKISNNVNYTAYLRAVTAESTPYADANKLLTPLVPGSKPPQSNKKEWETHFGLLASTYQRTNDENLKETIRFLMVNYLAKAAFLNEFPLGDFNSREDEKNQNLEHYQNMLQVGMLTLQGTYHRSLDSMMHISRFLGIEEKVGSAKEKAESLIPMDTMNVESLFPLRFVVTPDLSRPDDMVKLFTEEFDKHLEEFPNTKMEFPFLIDITKEIGQLMITDNDHNKIASYEAKQLEVKEKIQQIINSAAASIKDKYPDLKNEEGIADYLRTNLVVVSRAQVQEGIAVLSMHSEMFSDADFDGKVEPFKRYPYLERLRTNQTKLKEWSAHTGISTGAISMRQIIGAQNRELDKITAGSKLVPSIYNVGGKTNLELYYSPTHFLDHQTFGNLVKIGENKDNKYGPAQQLQAKATAKMIEVLLTKIPREVWIEKQAEPAVRELTQMTLLRTSEHLATANLQVGDFRQFSQAIDRAHAELTTLLALYEPFDANTFGASYQKYLEPNFPEGMRPAAVGLTRSAMNTFSGINAALMKNQPNPVRICGEHSYYEEQALVGSTQTLDKALDDPNIKKIDLYVGEFYHNIDIDPNHTHYQKGPIIEDIKQIFAKKPDTDSLTVAVDATIDYTKSENIKALLAEFKNEIDAGKLNIIIFRSGQKFDMMGLDNYFGSPYYTINNGDAKWGTFNNLSTDEAFRTDRLSQQFFCWMAETGPELVDEYKKLVFNNTRTILRHVPEELRPDPNRSVCVCDFAEGVESSFLDIKIDPPERELEFLGADTKYELEQWVKKRFFEIYIEHDKLAYARGSFGFPSPNITWIDPKMRINPGIDPSEIGLYATFFDDLAKKVKELEDAGRL